MGKFALITLAIFAAIGFVFSDEDAAGPLASKGLSVAEIRGPETPSRPAQVANTGNVPNKAAADRKHRDRAVVLGNLEVEVLKWTRGGFDTVMIADFKVTNKNGFDLKDVTIKCDYFASSGTRLDSSTRTAYEVFPAGKSKTIREFNMGWVHSQARQASCSVIGFLFPG